MKLKDIYIRDPFILKENGKYYMYGTTDPTAWEGAAGGFKVYVSEDLEDFQEKVIFSATEDFWSNENFWAPECHKIGDKFYLFATFYRRGMMRRSQILVCDTPDGTFVPLNEPLTPADWNSLDATYFQDGDKKYTIFCHEWTQIKNGEICLAELDDNLQIKGEIKTLFKATDAPWVRMLDVGENNYVTDGPYLRKMSNGKILMLWSSFGEEGYAMGMAVADKIDGEWKHIEKPIITKNGGHGMIFEDYQGKLFIVYHQPNQPHMLERAHLEEVVEKDGILVIK